MFSRSLMCGDQQITEYLMHSSHATFLFEMLTNLLPLLKTAPWQFASIKWSDIYSKYYFCNIKDYHIITVYYTVVTV